MKELLWKLLARLVSTPSIANLLISYAMKTPYTHLPSNENPTYMARYWVFNPYDRVTNEPRWGWLIPFSIRVHNIKREDYDRALHDHPWDARTIILKGWYIEKRLNPEFESMTTSTPSNPEFVLKWRVAGDTALLGFEEYHTIVQVSDEPLYTLFFSWKWQGVWGFLVNGKKIPWKTYLYPNKDAE